MCRTSDPSQNFCGIPEKRKFETNVINNTKHKNVLPSPPPNKRLQILNMSYKKQKKQTCKRATKQIKAKTRIEMKNKINSD